MGAKLRLFFRKGTKKAPMRHAPGLIDTLIFCLKSRSYSVQNGPDKKRVERIINTRLWFNSNH